MGVTLLELLVAIVLAGLLMSMLGQVVHQFVQSSQAIDQEQARYAQMAGLRRVLHRDLQNLSLQNATLTPQNNGFTCRTSHSMLGPGPLPVKVTWEFSENKITRHEESPALNYSRQQLILTEMENWNISFYQAAEHRWIELSTLLLNNQDKQVSGETSEEQGTNRSRKTLALKIGLTVEGREYEIIEALPNDEAVQANTF